MGALADLDVADVTPISGMGSRLVLWWNAADEDDRATFRRWVADGASTLTLAERITASGFTISQHTVMYGLRQLRRLPEWAS